MSNWKKKNLNVFFCIVLSDCKVKREIPFKKQKIMMSIYQIVNLFIYLLFVIQKSNFVFAPTNKFIEIKFNNY